MNRGTIAAISLFALLFAFAPQAGRAEENPELSRGELILQKNCTLCHDLSRAFASKRASSDWQAGVREMAAKEGAAISPEDMKALEALHVERQRDLAAEKVFKERCTKCHDLDKALSGYSEDSERWRQTINRMRGKDAKWISADEARVLVGLHVSDELRKK